MTNDNEGKWNENDLTHMNRINTLEKCSVSRMGAIKKHHKTTPKVWVLLESPQQMQRGDFSLTVRMDELAID